MLIRFDNNHELVLHYQCPECLGRPVIKWKEGRETEQIVMMQHAPTCFTGNKAFNQVHNNPRKVQTNG